MNLSVIVTTYNRPRALVKVLMGLAHQTRAPDEVIVADDGSDKQTAAAIQQLGASLSYPLHHVWHADLGFRAAKIRNEAINQSTGEYIVLLDGDCIPNRHFVNDHLRLARRGCFFQGKRVLITQKATDRFDWRDTNASSALIKLMFGGGMANAHHLIRCTCLPALTSTGLSGTRSCNMGLFKSDLVAVNGFNEDFWGWGREDSELVARLYRYGLYRQVHAFMAICFHLWHAENTRERLSHNDDMLKKALRSNDYYTPKGLAKGS